MRQFILTFGSVAAFLTGCWSLFQGISGIIRNDLTDSLYYIFIATPIAFSLAIVFDEVNSQLHTAHRRFMASLKRRKGAQLDIYHPDSPEVKETPWEHDSSHTER